MANKSKKSTAKVKAKTKVKAKPKAKAKSPVKSKVKAPGKAPVKAKSKVVVKAKVKAKTTAKVSTKAKPKSKAKPAPKVQVKAKSISVIAAPKKAMKMTDYSKAITPLADRLVIRVVQTEKVTPGGIIIPDTVSTIAGHIEGEVLAVGHGSKNKKGSIKPLDVQVGDFVLFSEHSGTPVVFNSEELQIIKESDVMGIVQK